MDKGQFKCVLSQVILACFVQRLSWVDCVPVSAMVFLSMWRFARRQNKNISTYRYCVQNMKIVPANMLPTTSDTERCVLHIMPSCCVVQDEGTKFPCISFIQIKCKHFCADRAPQPNSWDPPIRFAECGKVMWTFPTSLNCTSVSQGKLCCILSHKLFDGVFNFHVLARWSLQYLCQRLFESSDNVQPMPCVMPHHCKIPNSSYTAI